MEILIAVIAILALAIVPMLLYALLLWWFDRYEKEPLIFIAAAFIWGAVPAIIFSLIAQILLDIPLSLLVQPGIGTELLGASLFAPVTEEVFKGWRSCCSCCCFERRSTVHWTAFSTEG